MTNRATAFLDILGFKSLVDNSSEDEILKIISSLYFYEKSAADERRTWSEVGMCEFGGHQATFFSDCLVVSVNEKNIGRLVMSINLLSAQMIRQGLFLRGGLTVGPLYHSDNIVFGKALNEAHLMESKMAVNPRVLMSDAAIDSCQTNCQALASDDEYMQLKGIGRVNENLKPLRHIKKDCDGKYYINPFPAVLGSLNFWKQVNVNNEAELAVFIGDLIRKSIQKWHSFPRILEKMHWLALKYNENYCGKSGYIEIQL